MRQSFNTVEFFSYMVDFRLKLINIFACRPRVAGFSCVDPTQKGVYTTEWLQKMNDLARASQVIELVLRSDIKLTRL